VDLHALATRELPRPPARVLEVGCGKGELARTLAADGYDVLAIDPRAPKGPIFRRTTLEELRDEGPFDAALASFAIHHVDDLAVALDKLHSLLRRDAPLVVRDFAWDLVDEPTARWDYERLGRKGGFAEWCAEHQHLHGFDAMRSIGGAAVELTRDDVREIESAVSNVTVHGDRYPERLEKLTGR